MEGSRRSYLMKLEDRCCHFPGLGRNGEKRILVVRKESEFSNRAARSRHLHKGSRGLAQTVPGAQGRELCFIAPPVKPAAAGLLPLRLRGSCLEAVLLRRPEKRHARDSCSGHTVDKSSFSRRHSHTPKVRQSPGYLQLPGGPK